MAKGRKVATKKKPAGKQPAKSRAVPKKATQQPADPPKPDHKYSIRATAGRPAHYETPEQLQEAVDNYFIYCEGEYHLETQPSASTVKKPGKSPAAGGYDQEAITEQVKVWDRYPEPYTVTGLVLYLGFAHRQSLDDYEGRAGFSDIIKRARSRVENAYEKRLFNDRPTGAIFALTNMGWKNQQNFDHTSGGERITKNDLSKLSDDELTQLAALQQKISGE